MKKKMGIVFISATVLMLAACVNEKKEITATTEKTEISTETSKTETSTIFSTKEATAGNNDWSKINESLKKETEAKKVEVLYENNEPIQNEKDGASVTINGYEYLSIENFSRNLRIPFGDQVEKGGVLLVSATVKNKTANSVYAGSSYSMMVTGYSSSIGNSKEIIDEDNELISDLVSRKYEVKPGEELSGYIAFSVKPEAMDKIAEHKEGEFEIPGMYSKADSFSKDDAVLEAIKVRLPLSKDGADSLSEDSLFYPDKVTVDNMGKKTMLVDKQIGESKDFSGIKTTFDGYQVTEFVPNEDEASRFTDFDTGVVLLTAKLTVKNEGKETINLNQTGATLTTSKVKMLNELFLETDSDKEELSPGEEGNKYIVFIMDKESYEKLYSDKEFVLDVNLSDQKMARMTSIGDVSFTFKN